MQTLSLVLTVATAFCTLGLTAAQLEKPADSLALESVLKTMDTAAANFHTTQAEFEWDSYEKVINEVDEIQTGTIYFRRSGKDIEMMADVKMAGPDLKNLKQERKNVLYSGGKISIYQPKIEQVTVYDLGKNKVDLESYVVLGFGGSGHDLTKSFDVTYVRPETIDGAATAQLQLIPKSEKVRNNYNKILLWIDLDRGISLQQQFFSPQGDYRLTKYTSIQLNEKKIPDDVFKLKTNGKTKTISPKG
ncbi:MAG TPA: outer membrane lipoprotein carrier protein LolA [Candidatus Sulfotelmatobacter sp.]|nr:outer membrane lipoprotein carrier protein LolA [Candidatus Sulfotelmatobacter sp.]